MTISSLRVVSLTALACVVSGASIHVRSRRSSSGRGGSAG